TGTLTFDAEPGRYTCEVTLWICVGKVPGTSPILPPPGSFPCSPGQPIDFANLTDCGGDGLTFTLTVSGTDVHGNSSVTPLNWTVDTTRPSVNLGTATSDSDKGTLTISYTVSPDLDAVEGVSFLQCSLDGHDCTCGQTSATCSEVAAGDHF